MDLFGFLRIKRIRHEPATIAERYPEVLVGRGTYGLPLIYGLESGVRLQIGSFCSIAEEVVIFLGMEHRTDWVTTFPFSVLLPGCENHTGHPATKGDVVIENDVWLGYGCTILSGVRIGTGAVVGCRAVVTKDVPPYTIVAGNPARVVRARFSEEEIKGLLESKWWDLSEPELRRLMPLLLSDKIQSFLEAVHQTRDRPPSAASVVQ